MKRINKLKAALTALTFFAVSVSFAQVDSTQITNQNTTDTVPKPSINTDQTLVSDSTANIDSSTNVNPIPDSSATQTTTPNPASADSTSTNTTDLSADEAKVADEAKAVDEAKAAKKLEKAQKKEAKAAKKKLKSGSPDQMQVTLTENNTP